MILSLLIWYFIPLQLCSPHCTTCVYCLKHTCQIKEQLMHLIFNYCLLHHHAQWENVKASNLQYFKQQSVTLRPPSTYTDTLIGIWILNIICHPLYALLAFYVSFCHCKRDFCVFCVLVLERKSAKLIKQQQQNRLKYIVKYMFNLLR